MGRHELENLASEANTTDKIAALNDAKEAAYDAKEANREAMRVDPDHVDMAPRAEEPTTLKIAHAAERVWDSMMEATVNAWDSIKPKPTDQDPSLPPASNDVAADRALVEMRSVPKGDEKIDEKRVAKDTWDVAKDTASGLKAAVITEPIAALKHEAPKPRKRHVKPNNTVLPVLDNVAKKGTEVTDRVREAGVDGWENTKKAAEDFSERHDKAGNLPLSNQARRNRRARKAAAKEERTYAAVAAAAQETTATL